MPTWQSQPGKADPVTKTASGVRFAVRLTPKGGRNAIEGWAAGADGARHLKARVSAVPEAGKANAALIVLMAKALGVPRSAIAIVSGESARLKSIFVRGEPAYLAKQLESWGEMG